MSSTVAHAAAASWIAVTAAHVQPHESSYILAAVISAGILDLDHVFFVIRDRDMYRRLGYRDNLHHARSVFHELAGLLVVGALSGLLFFADQKLACVVFLAFALHVIQDWLLSKSAPLSPVDDTAVQLFALSFKQKVIVDVCIVILFGGLWILYLAGCL